MWWCVLAVAPTACVLPSGYTPLAERCWCVCIPTCCCATNPAVLNDTTGHHQASFPSAGSTTELAACVCLRAVRPLPGPPHSPLGQAAFAELQASCAQGPAVLPGGHTKWPRTLPEHSSCTYAQLMLLHGAGWPNHVLWEHWQGAHPPGSVALFVHLKVRGHAVTVAVTFTATGVCYLFYCHCYRHIGYCYC